MSNCVSRASHGLSRASGGQPTFAAAAVVADSTDLLACSFRNEVIGLPASGRADVLWERDSGDAQSPVSVVTGQARRRWAVVAAGVALLCALPAIVAAIPVPASALSPTQLRARVIASADVAYEGYAESHIDLNLPKLPHLYNVIALLDGTTDQYTWYRSAQQWRADTLSAASENDTYQTSQGVFIWDYGLNLLTQIVGSQPVRLPRAADLLPPQLARRLISFAGHTDRMYRLPAQRVAGIDAAGFRLVPGSGASTISAVDIWADPGNGVPVQVEIFARGMSSPVLVSRFLDLGFAKPPVATVTPRPGPGVSFAATGLPNVAGILNAYGPALPSKLGGANRVPNPGGLADVAAYGNGLARFAVVPLPASAGDAVMQTASSAGASIQLTGSSAAVLITSPLLVMLIVRSPIGHTFLLTGAVTAQVLERAATQLMDFA
jgi:hypothetical protein